MNIFRCNGTLKRFPRIVESSSERQEHDVDIRHQSPVESLHRLSLGSLARLPWHRRRMRGEHWSFHSQPWEISTLDQEFHDHSVLSEINEYRWRLRSSQISELEELLFFKPPITGSDCSSSRTVSSWSTMICMKSFRRSRCFRRRSRIWLISLVK